MKVELLAPPAILKLAGTVAAAVLLLDKATTMPPAGAGPLKLAVPCELLPPATLDGLSVNEASAAAVAGAAARLNIRP